MIWQIPVTRYPKKQIGEYDIVQDIRNRLLPNPNLMSVVT